MSQQTTTNDTLECDHPLESRRVRGNPDPMGERNSVGGGCGVYPKLKMDATCTLCGASVPVVYQLDAANSYDALTYGGDR